MFDRVNAAAGPHVLVAGGFLVLTIAWAHFLLGHLGSGFAHDAGDPLLNTWILWWNARTLPFSPHWWDAPAFYPATGVAAFTENLAGLGLVATPVFWVSGNPVLAHNVTLLASFLLAALAAYALCFELTRSMPASIVGATAFAFAPYRIVQLPHIQVLTSYWLPFALFALHRFLGSADRRWLGAFGCAWLVGALCNGYFMFFFAVLLAVWLVWFVVMPRRWSDLGAIGAAWVIASIPLMPVFLKYRQIHERYGFSWGRDAIMSYSGDVGALLTTSPHLSVWGWLQQYPKAEGELFPGAVVVLVVVAGIVCVLLWPARSAGTVRRGPWTGLRVAAKVVMIVEAAAILVRAIWGPWRLNLGLFTISLSRVERPLLLIAIVGILLLVTSQRIRSVARTPPPLLFYVGAAVLMWLLTLGPRPAFFGRELLETGPYEWLLLLPGFDSLRVPARFWTLSILCLSASAALAFAMLTSPLSRFGVPLTLLAAGGIFAEGWAGGMPVEAAPSRWECSAPAGRAAALLELPLGDVEGDLRAMYRGLAWDVPVVNGYSGHTPPHYEALVYGLRQRDPAMLTELASRGNLYVLIDDARDGDGGWRGYAASHPGATPVDACPGSHLYRIRATRAAADAIAGGAPARIAAVASDVSGDTVTRVTDGNLRSRWEVGQTQPHWVQADLGARLPISEVVLRLGSFSLDFPRRLSIAVSDDASAWREVWSGPTHRETFRAALAEPRQLPLRFPLNGVSGRYLKLTQTGFERTLSWSIAELEVLVR